MKRKIAIVGATMEGFMQLCDLVNIKGMVMVLQNTMMMNIL